jgi:hypothetical protein
VGFRIPLAWCLTRVLQTLSGKYNQFIVLDSDKLPQPFFNRRKSQISTFSHLRWFKWETWIVITRLVFLEWNKWVVDQNVIEMVEYGDRKAAYWLPSPTYKSYCVNGEETLELTIPLQQGI